MNTVWVVEEFSYGDEWILVGVYSTKEYAEDRIIKKSDRTFNLYEVLVDERLEE